MIEVSVTRFRERHGAAPVGSHRWVFQAEGSPVGGRGKRALHYTYETDGPFPEARTRALTQARLVFGVTATITMELMP